MIYNHPRQRGMALHFVHPHYSQGLALALNWTLSPIWPYNYSGGGLIVLYTSVLSCLLVSSPWFID